MRRRQAFRGQSTHERSRWVSIGSLRSQSVFFFYKRIVSTISNEWHKEEIKGRYVHGQAEQPRLARLRLGGGVRIRFRGRVRGRFRGIGLGVGVGVGVVRASYGRKTLWLPGAEARLCSTAAARLGRYRGDTREIYGRYSGGTISPLSRLYLANISPISRPYLR